MKPVSKIDQYAIKKVMELRKAKGISQADLSGELEVSSGWVGQVESMKTTKRYTLEMLDKIATVLKCSPQDFLPTKSFWVKPK